MKSKNTEISADKYYRIKTISTPITEELIVKKSKFIANAIPLKAFPEIDNYLNQIRTKFSDASHNCYAYIFGNKKELYRFYDDGEPSGTAGKPIYQTILNFDITNVLVVVTRYFGGIKLGTSGLIRAYSEATKLVLSKAEIIEIPETKVINLEVDYSFYPKIKVYIYDNLLEVKEIFKSNKVEVSGIIASRDIKKLKENLMNLTSGKIIINEEQI